MAFQINLKFIDKLFVRHLSRHVVPNNYSKLPQDQKHSIKDDQSNSNSSMSQSKCNSKHGLKTIGDKSKMDTENIVSNIITDPIIPIEPSVYDLEDKSKKKDNI